MLFDLGEGFAVGMKVAAGFISDDKTSHRRLNRGGELTTTRLRLSFDLFFSCMRT